jgi:hypothetical protein
VFINNMPGYDRGRRQAKREIVHGLAGIQSYPQS